MAIKFRAYEDSLPSCRVDGRVYAIRRAGSLYGASWEVLSWTEDLTSRPKEFPTVQAACIEARKLELSEEGRGISREVAKIMISLVCELETEDSWIYEDRNGVNWILNKKTLVAKRAEKNFEATGARTAIEAERKAVAMAEAYQQGVDERAKWAWKI